MTLRSHLVLPVAIAAACTARPIPEPPPPTEPLTRQRSQEPDAPTAPDEETVLRPYVEVVEIDGEWDGDDRVSPFAGRYALMEHFAGERHRLLDLTELKLVEMPEFADEHKGKARFLAPADGEWGLAYFEHGNEAEFEILEVDTMQWTVAPPIEIPSRPSPFSDKKSAKKGRRLRAPPGSKSSGSGEDAQTTRRKPRFQVWFQGDRVRVTLSEDGRTARYLELDPATLVWEEHTEEEVRASDPCPVPCGFRGRDVVRWGVAHNGEACAAYRETPQDEWSLVEVDDRSCMRSCRELPNGDVFVSGGIDQCRVELFSIRMSRNAAILDTSELKARDLGEVPPLGYAMELGTDELVWLRSGFVVRFDPETETFDEEPAPRIEFEKKWEVRLDERTMLIGGVDGNGKPKAVKFGFR